FIGMFMETIAGIILLAPILLPVVTELGVHPVHFGIIMILAAEVGFLMPPVGDNLNVASAISGLSLVKVAKSTLRFTIVLIILLCVFTLCSYDLVFVSCFCLFCVNFFFLTCSFVYFVIMFFFLFVILSLSFFIFLLSLLSLCLLLFSHAY